MPYFTKLYEEDELPSRAKLVFLYLCDRMNKEGVAWPGLNRMAADLSMSRSTVKRAIRDLEQAGLVRKEESFRLDGKQSSNRYRAESE